jgi:hypothetical protein
MPRTHKQLLKQNLYQLPVLVQDTGVESTYFNIKQLSGVFTGGRNAFLISGTQYLQPNTQILIEVLDSNGNSIYVEAIKNFVEASARLVVVEVYEDTPAGAAILTIIGTARLRASDNTPLPTDTSNVRWQKKIVIEPRSNNIAPIRIKKQPQLLTQELLQSGSVISQSVFNVSVQNILLAPKFQDTKQKGYLVNASGSNISFASYQLYPKLTGSLFLESRIYTSDTSIPTSSYSIVASETASVNQQLTLFSSTKAFTDTNITASVGKQVINISPVSSVPRMVTQSSTTVGTITTTLAQAITSSVVYNYVSQSYTYSTSSVSYANVRIINLDTVSGEIFRVKTFNKDAASQNEFSIISDSPTTVGNILSTSSVYFKEIPLGTFNSQNVINTYWYGNYVTGSTIPDTLYTSPTASLSLGSNSTQLLDAAYVITPSSSYFFGTKNNFNVFATSEYTLMVDAYMTNTSASQQYTSSTHKTDIYVVGSAARTTNPLGLYVGSLYTSQSVGYFQNKTFNFRVPVDGTAGLRFVINTGFWQFANISLTVAQENAYSPDEVVLTVPNTVYKNANLLFKTELFDLNNNALRLDIISNPTYFSGSTL